MDGKRLALLVSRALQILFAAVVLGTSVHAYKRLHRGQNICDAIRKDKECDFHGLISTLGFGAAVGAYGMIDAMAGIVSCFMDFIPYMIMLGLDALAAVVYLAGGAAIAGTLAKLNGCNGSICTEVKADSAFNFLGLIITVALIGMGFFWQRSGGKMHSAV